MNGGMKSGFTTTPATNLNKSTRPGQSACACRVQLTRFDRRCARRPLAPGGVADEQMRGVGQYESAGGAGPSDVDRRVLLTELQVLTSSLNRLHSSKDDDAVIVADAWLSGEPETGLTDPTNNVGLRITHNDIV